MAKLLLVNLDNGYLKIIQDLSALQSSHVMLVEFDKNNNALSADYIGKVMIWNLMNTPDGSKALAYLSDTTFASNRLVHASFSSNTNQIITTHNGIIKINDFKGKSIMANSIKPFNTHNSSYFSKFKFSDKYISSFGGDKSIVYLDIRNLKTPYGVLHITDDQNDVDKFTINSNGDKVIVYKTDGKLNKIDILPFINLEKNI